jgi:FkbM family methyltransferase
MIGAKHILHPARTAHSLYRRLRKARPKFADIGSFRLRLSDDSQLLNYKNAFHLYDTALGKIASVLGDKYPDLHAIDIGSNVGDTAALIRESGAIPVLCVEGDPAVRDILSENIALLGPGIEIEHSFVGADGLAVDLEIGRDVGSNACLVGAVDAGGKTKLRSLRAILADHPRFARSKLLKIDTEGFDFEIIKQSIDFASEARPVIFFEYDPQFHPEEAGAGLETVQALKSAGYSDFIYYDNFGNFLLHCGAGDNTILADLDSYLASNRRHGTAVYYFDVCALHHEDAELVPEIKALTQR